MFLFCLANSCHSHVSLSVTGSTPTKQEGLFSYALGLNLFFKSYYCQVHFGSCRTPLCYSSLLTVSQPLWIKSVFYLWWIFFFLLDLISLSSILEVIVITRKEIQKMLNLDTKMKLDFVCISDNMDMGTADSLRHIHQKIKVLLEDICV